MLHIACCLWDPNERSHDFSLCYDESWVEKLYCGFRRNLTVPFRFVCFTDRDRRFSGPIHQERLATEVPHYGCLIEPYKLNEPTIICGLDMVVVRNVDHFARYCWTSDKPALVGHPTNKDKFGFINPVVFVPAGWRSVYEEWRGENDMDYLKFRADFNDANEIWPGQLLSLKLNNVILGAMPPPGARIIYFHGKKKPHELDNCGWIKQHWV
jgi:hypothetical protein